MSPSQCTYNGILQWSSDSVGWLRDSGPQDSHIPNIACFKEKKHRARSWPSKYPPVHSLVASTNFMAPLKAWRAKKSSLWAWKEMITGFRVFLPVIITGHLGKPTWTAQMQTRPCCAAYEVKSISLFGHFSFWDWLILTSHFVFSLVAFPLITELMRLVSI